MNKSKNDEEPRPRINEETFPKKNGDSIDDDYNHTEAIKEVSHESDE